MKTYVITVSGVKFPIKATGNLDVLAKLSDFQSQSGGANLGGEVMADLQKTGILHLKMKSGIELTIEPYKL